MGFYRLLQLSEKPKYSFIIYTKYTVYLQENLRKQSKIPKGDKHPI